MTRPSISLAFAAAAALALASAGPAYASASPAPAGDTFRIAVPVSDLDLGAASGRRELRRRLRALAVRTCAPRPFPAAYDAAELSACHAAFERAAEAASAASRGTR